MAAQAALCLAWSKTPEDTFCRAVNSSIPYKRQYIGRSAKRHKPAKPWWNDNLSDLWARLSRAESNWLKRSGQSEKVRTKAEYVRLRKDNSIQLEVINQDGPTSTSTNDVLNRWKMIIAAC